ncbi:MAG: hypothetical protein JW724_00125 [Candidatus Altiarchaeota archaeon]|nr:hypothetical protein [Candidatus Altiarchaeota archaeon]
MDYIYVPKEIGICVDDRGFLGLLDLGVERRRFGVREYLGIARDHNSDSYVVDFHMNENTSGLRYALYERENPVANHVYYVTDGDSIGDVAALGSYVLYLDENNQCGFEKGSGPSLPGVVVRSRRWRKYFEVVKPRPK